MKIYVFGIEDSSQLARYYIEHDTEHTVIGHCVHRKYMPENAVIDELPIIALEDVVEMHVPAEIRFFAPLYARQMNKIRRRIFEEIKGAGHSFISYVSSRATVYTDKIGENTFIGEDCTLQPFTSIGDNTVIWAGNHIGHHSSVGNHCYVAGHVAVSGRVKIEDHCFLGGNCTIRDNITIGEGTLVVMHSAIMNNTNPWSVWRGNPARIITDKTSMDIEL